MGRTKPKTRHIKREVIGSRTGVVYKADEFPELGLLIVHGPGSKAVFQRGAPGQLGWQVYRAIGDPRAISIMRLDFEGQLPPHEEEAG
jgi:hypothetical protein